MYSILKFKLYTHNVFLKHWNISINKPVYKYDFMNMYVSILEVTRLSVLTMPGKKLLFLSKIN